MAFYKNLFADSILKVNDEDISTYEKYSEVYAKCDENGNLLEKESKADKADKSASKVPKAKAEEPKAEPKSESAKAEEPKAENGVEER